MSTVGKSNDSFKKGGFTLIELIVVISIISVLLVFSFPTINHMNLFSDQSGHTGDMIRLIEDLKIRAVRKNLDYQLHLDTVAGKLWITHENMDNQQLENAGENAVLISDGLIISDVEFPFSGRHPGPDITLTFRKQGYSDSALIHMMQDGREITIKLEPFLLKTDQLDHYVSFEDCI